jgi:hypothetical protein
MMDIVHIIGLLLIVGVFWMLFWRRRQGVPPHGDNPREGMPGTWPSGSRDTGSGSGIGSD